MLPRTTIAAIAAAGQAWLLAGILVLAFGIFDLFDGALARATGRASAFGAFLDSTLDRAGENLVYAGIAVGSAAAGFSLGVGLAVQAMATSSIVTYARARAESVGIHGEVGVAPRPERLIILVIGLVFAGLFGGVGPDAEGQGNPALGLALATIAALSAVTVGQRIVHAHRQLEPSQPTQPSNQENRS
jgi:CDP-diacylglycerol--glycerol-3-phosphate 3-phosphatidyltransferase